MFARRARVYDALALLTALAVIALDLRTKALVVENLSPPGSKPEIPLLGKYLVLNYIQNRGAAFSLFAGDNNGLLAIFIVIAIGVVAYLYARMINSGPLIYKIVFGLIIGGAFGNLLDRANHNGSVVDFLSFRIPEINYYFAIFNLADVFISVGVFALFVLVLFGGFHHAENTGKEHKKVEDSPETVASPSSTTSSTLHPMEQDAQS